jgi:hypothetical protein
MVRLGVLKRNVALLVGESARAWCLRSARPERTAVLKTTRILLDLHPELSSKAGPLIGLRDLILVFAFLIQSAERAV